MIDTTQNTIGNKSLFGWCLFDFAMAIPVVIGGIYFSKWYIENVGATSTILNLLFFSATLIIFLSGRWVGRKIDSKGYQFWIKLSSFIVFLSLSCLFLSSQFLPNNVILYSSFLFFLIFLSAYQITRICHNTYLHQVIPENLQTKMSGLGTASNWAGSVIGILITIPVVLLYPGIIGRELTFLIAVITYGILIVPSLILMFRASSINTEHLEDTHNVSISWKTLMLSSGTSLVMYFLIFDVMATVQKNLPPYLTKVFEMKDDVQAIGFLVILLSATIGGLIASRVVNFTTAQQWLKIGSIILTFSIILITLQNTTALWVAFVTAGASYGMLESAIRIHFMKTFSARNAGENFGMFAMLERASGIIGPLIWIVPFWVIKNEVQSYIGSMLLMSVLGFIAFLILSSRKKSV